MIFSTQRNKAAVRIIIMAVLALTGSALMFSYPAVLGGGDAAAEATASGKIPFPRPQSHRANWIEYHGKTVDLNLGEGGQAAQQCIYCHDKSDCYTCHNTRMPRDHNNFWRTRGHGFSAEANRERCITCHKQDYCIRCHNETAPRTHTANWRTRHCTWCHFNGGVTPADNCVVCHKQAPHTAAPLPLHPPIGAQTTCIQIGCHQ